MARDEGMLAPKKEDQQRLENDFEMFLRDVEEDTELRQTLALYKAKHQKKTDAMEGVEGAEESSVVETEASEDEVPRINVDELMDDFDELDMNDET